MIELRNRGKRDAQDDRLSGKKLKNELKFGKLDIAFIIRDG
jgi:hypothetical protein